MKQKLLALAALLSTAAGLIFVSFDSTPPEVVSAPAAFGNFEVPDRNLCDISPCNTAACDLALAHLRDGGETVATPRFVECPVRVQPAFRARAFDAGVSIPAGKYHQIRFIALCKSGACAVPVDDNGWPSYAVGRQAHKCAWKLNATDLCFQGDGGVIDERSSDGGWDPNTRQPGDFTGPGCTRRSCVEIAGDPE